MDNQFFVELSDPRAVIVGKNEELWLPISESTELSKRTETVNCAGVFFDVVGYSEERDALLIVPIVLDGAADNIEQELATYLAEQ